MFSEEKPSSLDCVAVAYLALALVPQVPQKWLAETMTAHYPELCSYVRRVTKESFGGPIELGEAVTWLEPDNRVVRDSHAEGWQSSKKLPWRKSTQKGVYDAASALLFGTFSSLPLIERFSRDKIVLDHGRASKTTDGPRQLSSPQTLLLSSLLTLGSAVVAIGGYVLFSDALKQPTPEKKKNLSQMGDVGAMLGMGLFGGYNANSMSQAQHDGRVPAGLELDVEHDEGTIT